MKETAKAKITYLINSIMFLTAGIVFIVYRTSYLNLFHLLFSLILISLGAISLILNIIKTNKIRDIFVSITTFFTGIFFLNNKTKFLSLFPIIFGIYMILNGTGKIMTYFIFKENGKRNYYSVLIGGIIDLIFSFIMITSPTNNINRLAIIAGIYIMLFGVTYFYDFLKECFPNKFRNKRRVRITLPILVATFIPYEVLLRFNKSFDKWKTPVKVSKKDTSGKVDLEILIHVNEDNIGKWGHADICYKGVVYSYGCYDKGSRRFGALIGDGTLYEIKGKKKYIKYCNKYSDKTIFCFGITLTNEEKELIENKLKEIKSNTYPWDPYQNNGKIINDYAEELVEKADAKFYKFNKTTYKTYFIVFTNCVKLVDDVIGKTGSDILKINGALTPGVYYNYLNKELKRKNSNVIKKEIFKLKNKEM
jgi:uncharacterized membrane protein HdeD (DUF308 family)